MKILYAFQGTGNGHVARAQEIIPILKKYGEIDTLISGHQSQLKADFDINFQHKGISLLYDKTGGLSYRKTFFDNEFFKAVKTIREIELSQYDLIINDYEPITGWACKLKKLPMIELSHQASMSFKETPKPEKRDFLGELILEYYVPSERKIGFHFENYHPQIKKPVIRKKIRNLNPDKKGFYLVYLPSFSDENIIKVLKQIPVEWKVFSKYTKLQFRENNVEVYPIDEIQYLNSFENCDGILCNAGFESPAEALFMDKKLFVIPIHNQYEQECNACALDKMGIPNSKVLQLEEIENWVNSNQHLKVDYPNDIEEILVNEVLVL
ncbi:glycosyl transferase [Chryseobacterium camelliae]|uniref:Glycosyl transferase n=1 Tax=Chryseobacterium camelliae TaxID=1265445 RepID=A0ABY7QJ55_9FLAO|nr:glycosyltransferase family protein [Chryseobacterium camelliae]WBV59674.1 glycosyl transferase [Chryseobacterium camelliae]